MSRSLKDAGILAQLLAAAIAAGIACITVHVALHLPFGTFDPLTDIEHDIALVSALVVFVLVLYRIRRDNWTHGHTAQLFEIDDD